MNDVLVKTRFTPVLVRATPEDDVRSPGATAFGAQGPVRYDAPVPKTNGGAGKSKPAPKPRAAHLRACPFCRELFVDDETDVCPECGIAVRDIASLPPSPDADALEAEEGASGLVAPTVPQAEPLAWSHMGRGRAALLLCALVGLAAFYLPWAIQTVPQTMRFTGSDMAHVKPFFWSAFTAWLVLFPAAASRRTILKMVGARVALVFLSAIPAMQVMMMLWQVPTQRTVKGFPFEFHWGPGLFLTLAASVIATFFAFRFGGRLDDVAVPKGSSTGRVLH